MPSIIRLDSNQIWGKGLDKKQVGEIETCANNLNRFISPIYDALVPLDKALQRSFLLLDPDTANRDVKSIFDNAENFKHTVTNFHNIISQYPSLENYINGILSVLDSYTRTLKIQWDKLGKYLLDHILDQTDAPAPKELLESYREMGKNVFELRPMIQHFIVNQASMVAFLKMKLSGMVVEQKESIVLPKTPARLPALPATASYHPPVKAGAMNVMADDLWKRILGKEPNQITAQDVKGIQSRTNDLLKALGKVDKPIFESYDAAYKLYNLTREDIQDAFLGEITNVVTLLKRGMDRCNSVYPNQLNIIGLYPNVQKNYDYNLRYVTQCQNQLFKHWSILRTSYRKGTKPSGGLQQRYDLVKRLASEVWKRLDEMIQTSASLAAILQLKSQTLQPVLDVPESSTDLAAAAAYFMKSVMASMSIKTELSANGVWHVLSQTANVDQIKDRVQTIKQIMNNLNSPLDNCYQNALQLDKMLDHRVIAQQIAPTINRISASLKEFMDVFHRNSGVLKLYPDISNYYSVEYGYLSNDRNVMLSALSEINSKNNIEYAFQIIEDSNSNLLGTLREITADSNELIGQLEEKRDHVLSKPNIIPPPVPERPRYQYS